MSCWIDILLDDPEKYMYISNRYILGVFFFPNQFGLILGGLVSSLAHGKSGGIMNAFFWLIGSYQSSTFWGHVAAALISLLLLMVQEALICIEVWYWKINS